jgi:pilus assembly protein CpaE
MSYRVLLAFPDADLAAGAAALIREDPELDVIDSVADAGAVVNALSVHDVDAVLLHEDLGPITAMDLARDLGVRWPHVGIVLIVRNRSPDILRSALQSGARDVLSLPLSFEELQAGLRGAATWSRAVTERISLDAEDQTAGVGGTMIAVAGAKGGVGTTTVAVRLALDAAVNRGTRSICLVDFDLQAGDVGILLDLNHRRSIADLLEVADDISPRHLEETLYVHPSGLRVLLAPGEGERGEEVNAAVARQILGAIKFRYDVVVVDVGSVVTEGNAVAVEMADEVLVLTTPDVPSLRAANRLIALWERLQVRKSDSVKVVINRVNKTLEVQPDLVKKVVNAPLAKVVIPSGFKELEPAVNTGVPDRLSDGGLRRALFKLGQEVQVLRRGTERRRLTLSLRKSDEGQVAVETMGLTLTICLIALLMWEMALVGFTYVLAGHAAREGARELAVGDDVVAAVQSELWPAWRDGMRVNEGDDFVEVSLAVPVLVPGMDSEVRVSVRAGTVIEEARAP